MTLIVMKTMTMTVMVLMVMMMLMVISTSGSLFTFRRLTHGHIIQLQLQTMVGFRHLEIFVVSIDIEINFSGFWTPRIFSVFWTPRIVVGLRHPYLLWVLVTRKFCGEFRKLGDSFC